MKPKRKLRKGEEITVDYRLQPELEQPSDFNTNSVLELPLAQNGAKIPFDDWYKTVNPNFADTTNYRLRDAYNTLPIETLEAWRTNPDKDHLS